MPPLPFAFTVLIGLAIAALGVAAFLSQPAPYNILAASWRQTLLVLRWRPRMALYAFFFLLLQLVVPGALVRAPLGDEWIVASLLVASQGGLIFLLAHVAYRLHRGLIYSEWEPGLSFGRKESCMAIYVVIAWFVTMVMQNLPAPKADFISDLWTSLIGALILLVAFFVKASAILLGPAASLDDPQPLRRALASVRREPVAVFSVFLIIQISVLLLNEAFALIPAEANAFVVLRATLAMVATTFFFIFGELAQVILITRIWEDRYEPETRYAPHNLSWF